MCIVANIKKIREEIDSISQGVEIIAATKTRTIDEIKTALNTGLISVAGENRVQELVSKYDKEVTWDIIGQLQTNKVKYVIDKVRLVHGLDRLSLAQTIDKEAKKIGKVQDVLIEINSGSEMSKGGISLCELDAFLDEVVKFENIRVRGLMAVAPIADESTLRRLFSNVYEEFFKRKSGVFEYLSMGMSNDYKIAIECGSNMVRIGRGIFGDRRQC